MKLRSKKDEVIPGRTYFPHQLVRGSQKSDLPASNLLNMILNSIGDEVMLIDRDARIVYANASTVKGLGFSEKYLVGRSLTEFYKNKVSVKQWRTLYFTKLKKAGRPMSFVTERIVKGGKQQTIEVTAVYFSYLANEYVISVARDVTKRKQLDEVFRESEKTKAIQSLVAGTVKEIQYPLKAVLSRTQDILQKYQHRDFEYIGYKEFRIIMQTLKNISNQVNYCVNTADRLVTLNRRKNGTTSCQCQVNEVIRDIISKMGQELEDAGIHVSVKLGKHLPKVSMGEIDFRQIIVNLVSNAVEATPGGGKLLVKSAFLNRDNVVAVEIKDEGVGIPKEYLQQIFEPFFSIKHKISEKNAGLGLTIVNSIVKNYHGQIHIQSSLRKGTTVSVRLPVSLHPART